MKDIQYYYEFNYSANGTSSSGPFDTVEECKTELFKTINELLDTENQTTTSWKIIYFNESNEIVVESKQLIKPKEYKCETCGKTKVKLWRDYMGTTLSCVDCTLNNAGLTGTLVDDNGRRETEYGKTDQLGWYVPAIQVVPGFEMLWGYTSVPQNRVEEWCKLPTM